jgi:iron complex transport system ATP-binding protein
MGESLLETSGLSIGYRQAHGVARTVAADVNLTLRRGELVCLLGPNGTGKSTLLRTLSGLQSPLAGHVTLDGRDLHRLSSRERARHLSVVLTDRVTAGMMTGYDIVALGRHPHTDWAGTLTHRDHDAIRDALVSTDSMLFASRQMAELSDGERQRVMVARAVAQNPTVMVLDEITAFLDLPRRIEIMRLLARLAHERGVAIVMSTHDLDLALRAADRLWLFGGGRLLVGAPEDLVLAGAFDQTFAAEGLAFNRLSGTFTMTQEVRGRAAVVGNGVVGTWTARALERAGYDASGDATGAHVRVEVRNTDAGPEWIVARGATVQTVTALESLVAALRAE